MVTGAAHLSILFRGGVMTKMLNSKINPNPNSVMIRVAAKAIVELFHRKVNPIAPIVALAITLIHVNQIRILYTIDPYKLTVSP